MKLHKALKLRKKLVGEITSLKQQIQGKNSYLVGSLNAEKYNVPKLYDELLEKIDQLTGLKYVINEANKEIQAQIYTLAEYKALIAFWNSVPVSEGTQVHGYSDAKTLEYKVQIDEETRNNYVKTFQTRVDAIQEEIDVFNYTTEIPWDEPVIEPKVVDEKDKEILTGESTKPAE
jgi:hypothetical protein